MPLFVGMLLTALTAFTACLVLGPFTISLLRRLKFRQSIRDDGPSSHLKKAGTPTMGGILIIVALLAGLLVARPKSPEVIWVLFITLSFGLIGGIDDLIIIFTKRSLGLKARQKIILQIILGAFVVLGLLKNHFPTTQFIPFTRQGLVFSADLLGQFLFFIFAVWVIVGSSNAVNLTDGLDGLAAGTSAIAAIILGVLALLKGQTGLAILAMSIAGACFGFTWFNGPPAQVFMGDTGSLALGGALAGIALFSQTLLFLPLVGGIFVAETLSVMIQVTLFKLSGKRIFRMSPLHHHFELGGMVEPQIMLRFWMVGFVLGVLGLLGFLLRG